MDISHNTDNMQNLSLAIKPDVRVPIVKDNVREWSELVLHSLMLFFNTLGVLTNTINFAVLKEQGLGSDGITIGLFSLAIADFLSCLVMLPNNACYALSHGIPPLTFRNCVIVTAVPFRYSHFVCSRIICWITVYISVERSLCVIWPFKVKAILKPKVTAVCMCSIYVFFIAFYIPRGVSNKTIWRFDARFNATLAFNYETHLGKSLVYYQSLVGTVLFSFTAMIIITVATSLMLFKLSVSQKWRETAGNTQQNQSQNRRDREVMKTVAAVSGTFLVCLSMDQIPGFSILTLPGVSITGFNRNLFLVLYAFRCFFDSVTSSINFFIYMKTSSRYRKAFDRVFTRKTVTTKN